MAMQNPRADCTERLVEPSSLIERLARVVRPGCIPDWLNTPNPALDGNKPIEYIARGDCREVARVIAELEDPGAS